MIVRVVDANVVLAEPFRNKTGQQLTETFLKIEKEFKKRGFVTDARILDNESPTLCEYSAEASNSQFQLVTLNDHLSDSAERVIRTFKEQFLQMLT